ncbi:MAG: addiction module protein [Spirochaetaceae bacterium]|jgi:putative addiction module component (TIGR02574 family)|nr:addiction module protein [Spirochaetaceae bacterium]
MSEQEILKEVLSLKPQLRFLIVEEILKSLDQPDDRIDQLWMEECEKRVQAVKDGRLDTIPYEEIFG